MAVAIRLARGGMKKRPYYRIVVSDSRNSRDGKFIEKIGTYNPLLPKDSPERIKLDTERAAHWLGVGAQPTDRVARFLDAAGLRTRAARVNLKKGGPGEKAKERAELAAQKIAEAEAAAAEAAEKAAEEAELARLAAEEAANAPAPEAVAEEAPTEATAEEVAVEAVAEEAAPADEPAPAEEAPAEGADTAPAGDENNPA